MLSQKEITEMQCNVLIPNLKNPKTLALVKENIERISKGSSSHCFGALNLILEKAFEPKPEPEPEPEPKKPDPVGVKLRCSYTSCQWYNNHLSYSSVGLMVVYCQMCLHNGWGNRYLQCVGCGYNRTGAQFTTCQNCMQLFV